MYSFWYRGILSAIDVVGNHAVIGVSMTVLNYLLLPHAVNCHLSHDPCDNFKQNLVQWKFPASKRLIIYFFFFFFSFFPFTCRFSTLLDLDCSALKHWSVSGLFRFEYTSQFFWKVETLSTLTEHNQSTCSLFLFVCIQQVYMYFRGSGKAAEMKREAIGIRRQLKL